MSLCGWLPVIVLSVYLANVEVSLIHLLLEGSSLLGWDVKRVNEYIQGLFISIKK